MEKPEHIAGQTQPTIEVKVLDEPVRQHPPNYATAGSAGMDLRACIAEPQTIAPGDTVLIPTGIAIHISDRGMAAVILPPLDRLARLVFVPVAQVVFEVVKNFHASERGHGGFGSSGAR
jgi:dUTP pyrophosphatase